MSTLPPQLEHPARIARNAIELVGRELRGAPVAFDRSLVTEMLQQAIAGLYLVLDTTPEQVAHLEALDETATMIGDTERLLVRAADQGPAGATLARPIAVLADARRLLADHAEATREELFRNLAGPKRWSVPAPPLDESGHVPPFRASFGVPHAHSLRRPRLTPALDLGEDPPPHVVVEQPVVAVPQNLDDLASFLDATSSGALAAQWTADAPPDPSVTKFTTLQLWEPAVEEREVLRRMARTTLEDIASLGNLRKPIPTETWLDQQPFEDRLLANVDYFVSLGPGVLRQIAMYHAEAEVPDAMRAFSVAFTLGCIEGSDAIGLAVSILKQSPKEEFSGFADGFVLSPNPAVDDVLPELLTHPNVDLVAVAIEALGLRGTLPPEAVEWVPARSSPRLNGCLADALMRSLPRDVATRALESLRHIAAETHDDDLHHRAARALLVRDAAIVRGALRHDLTEPCTPRRRVSALELLAIAPGRDDVDLLLDALASLPAPTAPILRALGRFGHVALVSPLIDVLRVHGDDEGLANAAAEALERITGAGLRTTVSEPWETRLPPELRSTAERLGAPTPMRAVVKHIVDPVQWDSWWQEHRAELNSSVRLRGGAAFSAMQIVDELESPSTPWELRPEAAFELATMLGTFAGFRTDDWVARQKEHLSDLRDRARHVSGAFG
jgi:hypothetical protein